MGRRYATDKIIICKIYSLNDPETGEIRYIGKTVGDIRDRLCAHLTPIALSSKSHKNNWIKSLLKRGLKPTINLIEEIETSNIEIHIEKEKYWIDYHKKIGCKLVNSTLGGEGTIGFTPWNKGKHWNEEVRKKISASCKGRSNDAAVEAAKKVNTGRPRPKEVREKISKSHKGLNTWIKGRKHSQETKDKIARSKIGKPRSEELKKKMSEIAKNRIETRDGKGRLLTWFYIKK